MFSLVLSTFCYGAPFLESSCRSIKIVTSFSILKDFVEKITWGVPNIFIESIVPVEADPHTYQPTPEDSKTLAKADLIFMNGLDFEKGLEKLVASSGFQGKVCFVAEGMDARTKPLDPHLWHDVQKAGDYVRVIVAVLKSWDPLHQDIYQDNANQLLDQLRELDQWVHQRLSLIPVEQRLVVTTHDAFWYYGQAYGVSFFSPVGISTENEPTAKDVAALIDFIRVRKVKAVFIENLANPRLLQQIAEEAEVELQGVLYADSLSRPESPAFDYQAMIRHNTLTIQKALLGHSSCNPLY